MPIASRILDPQTGRPLVWLPQRENRTALRSFCAHHQHAARAFKGVEIPDNLTRDWIRVEDQGQLGSCQGQTIALAGEVLYHVATEGEVVQLSARKAYLDTQKRDGLLGADNGSTIWGGVQLATEEGFALEESCPYSDRYPNRAEIDGILAIPHDPRFRIRSGFAVESFQHALQCLAGGMVISIGTTWPFAMDSQYIVRDWSPQRGGGGHARCLCEIRHGLPTEVNSWGKRWGRNGRFSWEQRAFDAMLRDSSSTVVALCDLATPAPRRVDFASALFG